MNQHLNIFHTYTKLNNETHQLENDLTRALVICLQENHVFLHEVLKHLLSNSQNGGLYDQLFFNYSEDSEIEIGIQQNVSTLNEASHLVAVALSATPMDTSRFFTSTHKEKYDPIADLVIRLKDVVVIIEVKRHGEDCTDQLFNQAHNAYETKHDKDVKFESFVTPVDLNWKNLMEIVTKVSNFQRHLSKPSRVLNDFLEFVKKHNPAWLPIAPFAQQEFTLDRIQMHKRLDMALSQTEDKLEALGRQGFTIDTRWASEILFRFVYEKEGEQNFWAGIWPGNTKGQGWHLFTNDDHPPRFKDEITVYGKTLSVKKLFHLKFTHFQKYVTSLDGTEDDFAKPVLTRENFLKISGRQLRGDNNWQELQDFFDEHFKSEYNWREKCKWEDNLIESGRNYFDLSFGYQLWVEIPYAEFREVDQQKDDLQPLVTFLEELKSQMEGVVIN